MQANISSYNEIAQCEDIKKTISCAEVHSAAVREIYMRRTRVVVLGERDSSQIQLLILLGEGPMWEASG